MPTYGDQTIDNFSFAKRRLKNDKPKLVNIQILLFIILTLSLNTILRRFFIQVFFG
jgi:hypothetical protein